MINNRINTLVSKFKEYDIDGYIIPKNDEFFSEYAPNDRLKTISNFSGSAGYSIILKKKNYFSYLCTIQNILFFGVLHLLYLKF